MLLYCASQTEPCTLEQSSSMVRETFGIQIAKQSIDERFNIDSVAFVKEILKEAIEKQLSKVFNQKFLSQFNKIRIKDGTRFVLPEKLKDHYKGHGGNNGASSAAVCIQFEYDAKSGKILSLDITHSTRNDQTDAKETVKRVDLGDLIIRDLGYYSLPTLTTFDRSGAFFISRLGTKTNVYKAGEQEEISFKKLYTNMLKHHHTDLEMDLEVGKKERMPSRLIISIVPEEIYQKRIRKIEKINKREGYTTSEDFKARCRFNLFITNVDAAVLSLKEVILLYKLRWQVELMFKNWKSIFKIDEIQSMKYERFTCLLHAKLILIVINLQIIWNLKRYYHQKEEKTLSMVKCFNTLVKDFKKIIGILKKKKTKSENMLQEILRKFATNHWKEKRKERLNYEDILDIFICKSK